MVKGATCRSSAIGVLASVGATVTFGLCAGEEPNDQPATFAADSAREIQIRAFQRTFSDQH